MRVVLMPDLEAGSLWVFGGESSLDSIGGAQAPLAEPAGGLGGETAPAAPTDSAEPSPRAAEAAAREALRRGGAREDANGRIRIRPQFPSAEVREKALRLFEEGLGPRRVAAALGLSLNTVKSWKRRFNQGSFTVELSPNQYRWTEADKRLAVALRRTGLSWRQLAERTGISPATLRKWFQAEKGETAEKAGKAGKAGKAARASHSRRHSGARQKRRKGASSSGAEALITEEGSSSACLRSNPPDVADEPDDMDFDQKGD